MPARNRRLKTPRSLPPTADKYSAKQATSVNTKKVIHQLIEICSHGGIMQVGFGPGPDGKFHPHVLSFFKKLGAWLDINGEGIYATRPCEGLDNDEDQGIYYTSNKDRKTLYAFMTKWPGQELVLAGVNPAPESRIILSGYLDSLDWSVDNGYLRVNLPDAVTKDTEWMEKVAWMLKIENGVPPIPEDK